MRTCWRTGEGIRGKIARLLGAARKEPGVAAECIWSLFNAVPDSEEDWEKGIVGAAIVNDIRLELEAIRKGLSSKGKR